MHRIWYIDGVSCVGKTTFVASLGREGVQLDYAERCAQHPFFLRKHHDHALQVLYTASFCAQVTRAATTTPRPLLVDRSPISDVWYELIFKHYGDQARYEQLFQYIDRLNLFASYPTIFITTDASNAETIRKQMLVRANGIDSTSPDYVLRQIHVFEAVCERFKDHPDVRVVRIGSDPPMFTQRYFELMHAQIQRLTLS